MERQDYILQADRLVINYKRFKALNELTLSVPNGSIYGLIGKNGSGKTTFFRTVTGLVCPSSGSITVNAARMAAIVESPAIYADMTALQNMRYQCDLLRLGTYESIGEILEQVGLADTGKKKAKQFSLGMRQRLGLAIALLGNPDLILLDEPVNGLDPQGIIELRELILQLNKEKGITFLISSHILDELSKMATHYGFVDRGHLVKEISAEELANKGHHHMLVTVTDQKALLQFLEERQLDYKVTSENTVDILGEIGVTPLAVALDQKGCEILTIQCISENLESYYMDLIGGSV